MKFEKSCALSLLLVCVLLLAGCGSDKNAETRYEVVDGKVVEVTGDGSDVSSGNPSAAMNSGAESSESALGLSESFQVDGGDAEIMDSDGSAASAGQAAYDGAGNTDGTATAFPNDSEYNTISSLSDREKEQLSSSLLEAAAACRDVYAAADKGTAMNVTLSTETIGNMLTAMGNAGFSAIDSNGNFNMQCYEAMDTLGKSVYLKGNISGTYYVVYPDGHISMFHLSRESNEWHLVSMSGEWEDDCSFRIFSEGRYGIAGVKYTSRGWLIYSRNTSDFDENQKSNTGEYTMVRVLPYDSELKLLAEKYIEPVGYLENNLFTTTWNSSNFGDLNFNTLYAYLFGMYHGTQMLSSYNVRNYYTAVGGTKLYQVPSESFEKVVSTYFNITPYTLKNLAAYSNELDAYFFLGYDRDYYNVTPRTPSPEVISCATNSDGTLTLTVAAVNSWYGTDTAFVHMVTVSPSPDGSFQYISNTLTESEDNILPSQKLAEMLVVERSETIY